MSCNMFLATTFLLPAFSSVSLVSVKAVTTMESLLKVSVALFANSISRPLRFNLSFPLLTMSFVSAAKPTTKGFSSSWATSLIMSGFLTQRELHLFVGLFNLLGCDLYRPIVGYGGNADKYVAICHGLMSRYEHLGRTDYIDAFDAFRSG